MSSLFLPDNELDRSAVNNFRDYLKIPSVHPNPKYDGCIKFLEKQAQAMDLPITIYVGVPNKPIAMITWAGSNQALPAILLNSHMDVVPVYEEKWTHAPFAAEIDAKGNIYARGAQDMKCVGIQYLEAIRRLKGQEYKPKRTFYILFVPDEEIGGTDGMKKFCATSEFKKLNVGFALDEGMASPADEFLLFYGERTIWQLFFHIRGRTGHGSLLLANTAGEKLKNLLHRIYGFRDDQVNKLNSNISFDIGDVTTVNVTQIRGGVQENVIPEQLSVCVDCRIAPTLELKKFEMMLQDWCEESGSGIDIEFIQKQPKVPVTQLKDSNPYWKAFKEAADDLEIKLKQRIFPGGTDSRYLRARGIPAIGFSPINNTPILLHDNDEYLGMNTYLKGIVIYGTILKKLGDLPDTTG